MGFFAIQKNHCWEELGFRDSASEGLTAEKEHLDDHSRQHQHQHCSHPQDYRHHKGHHHHQHQEQEEFQLDCQRCYLL